MPTPTPYPDLDPNTADNEVSLLSKILQLFRGQGGGAQTQGASGGIGNNVNITGTTPTGNTTSTTTNLTTGGPTTITAGALSIEFLLSNDFKGTINGATFDNTSTNSVGVYRLDAPPWKPLASLSYTITAGSVILTVQT